MRIMGTNAINKLKVSNLTKCSVFSGHFKRLKWICPPSCQCGCYLLTAICTLFPVAERRIVPAQHRLLCRGTNTKSEYKGTGHNEIEQVRQQLGGGAEVEDHFHLPGSWKQPPWLGDKSLRFMNYLGSCRFAILPGGRRRVSETLRSLVFRNL